MAVMTSGTERTQGEFWESVIIAALIFVGGLASAIALAVFVALVSDRGAGALVIGMIGVILGLIIIWGAYRFPMSRLTHGMPAIILSLISLFLAGGGFICSSFCSCL